MQGFLSTASSGTVSYHHHPDHATYIATALEQIFGSTASAQERRQAAIDYIHEELIDTKRQAAAGDGERFHTQPDFFGPPPSTDHLSGLAVKPPNVCRQCADPVAIVGPGTPPHYASLRCRSCDLHRGWLSRVHCAYLAEVIADGVPRDPITISSSKPEKNDDGRSVVRSGMRKD